MQANIAGFTSSPAILNQSITAPSSPCMNGVCILVSVKQEKMYQGVSKKDTEMICVLFHLTILPFFTQFTYFTSDFGLLLGVKIVVYFRGFYSKRK